MVVNQKAAPRRKGAVYGLLWMLLRINIVVHMVMNWT